MFDHQTICTVSQLLHRCQLVLSVRDLINRWQWEILTIYACSPFFSLQMFLTWSQETSTKYSRSQQEPTPVVSSRRPLKCRNPSFPINEL